MRIHEGLFISRQGSCKTCVALKLFAACQWGANSHPPPNRIETKEEGRTGRASSAYLRQQSLCLITTHNTINDTVNWSITCLHAPINTKQGYAYDLFYTISQILLFSSRCKSLESRPTEIQRGYKHKHSRNGQTLIKSQVNLVKHINWGWCFSLQNKGLVKWRLTSVWVIVAVISVCVCNGLMPACELKGTE